MANRTFLILLSAFLLVIPGLVFSQTLVPSAEQPAYFVYAKGARSDKKLKVLLVSRHIVMLKDHELPAIETGLHLDFNSLVENIPNEERYFNTDYENIVNFQVEHEEIYGDYLKWNSTTIREAGLKSSDNTLSAMEKIRAKIIDDHQREGYKIFQIDFMPAVDGENRASYARYDTRQLKHVPFTIERRAAIPLTWIDYHRKGDIRYLLSQIKSDKSSSGSSGLVIEEKKKSSTTSSSVPKADNTDWAAKAAVARMNAEGFEAEGDRLNKMGALFIHEAIKQYTAAQQTFYTDRVQQKLNGLNSMVQAGAALNQGLENLEDFSAGIREALDEQGIRRFRGGNFSFSGFTPSYGSEAFGYNPMAASITYGFYRYLALEAGIGYGQSALYELYLTDQYENKSGESIFVSQPFGGLEIAAGIAIPIKSSVVYATYGINWNVLDGGAKLHSKDYEFPRLNDELYFKTVPQKFKGGFNFRFPKTRLAIGAHYTLTMVNGEKLIENSRADVKREGMIFRAGGSVHNKYQYGMFGASIYILAKDN